MPILEELLRVQSPAGVTVLNQWARHEDPASTQLLVMLPGQNYRCDTGALFYLKGMALQQGYDVLSLEYGFQVARTEPDRAATVAEVREAVTRAMAHGYSGVCFAGKSLGSPLAAELAREHRGDLLLLTPIRSALGPTEGLRALAVTGIVRACERFLMPSA